MAAPPVLPTDPPYCPVAYYEEAGWPKSQWDLENAEFVAVRHLICDWADRDELLVWIAAYPHYIYPYAEGPVEAISVNAAVEGFGAQGWELYDPDDGLRAPTYLATYPKARVIVKYSTKGPEWHNGTLRAEWLRPQTQRFGMHKELFRWDSGTGAVVDHNREHFIHSFDYVVKYYNVIGVPRWVLNLIGTCNRDPVNAVVLNGLIFGAQTLKYLSPLLENSITTGNVRTYNVTAYYSFQASGWNTHWRTSTAQFEPIYLAGAASPYIQYPLADF